MMAHVRQRWALRQTYKRISKIYNELMSLAVRKDLDLITQKLSSLIESYKSTVSELSNDKKVYAKVIQISLSEISSMDWSSLIMEMLEMVELELKKDNPSQSISIFIDLLNNGLSELEHLLKDEKFQPIITHAPALIAKVLDILDNLDAKEGKKLAVRFIGALGQNYENKLEIGRLDGFRKMLSLLVDGDKDLTLEIAKAFKHLAELSKQQSEDDPNNANSSLYNLARERVTQLASNVKDLLYLEVPALFNSAGEVKEGREIFGDGSTLPDKNQIPPCDYYIPSKESISAMLKRYMDSPSQCLNHRQGSQMETESISSYLPDEEFTGAPDNLIKEFMRVQGAIASLTNILKDVAFNLASEHANFDVFVTLCKLLFQNQMNQDEFKRMNGYEIFFQFFENSVLYAISEENVLLQDFFNIFFIIAINGSVDKAIGNIDALILLFRITSSRSPQLVRQYAVNCIQDLLSVNPINVAAVIHVDGVKRLVEEILIPEITNPQSGEGLLYIRSVINLLNYIAVLASQSDHYSSQVLDSYLHLLSMTNSSNLSSFTLLLVESFSSLLQDWYCRKREISPCFMKAVIDLIYSVSRTRKGCCDSPDIIDEMPSAFTEIGTSTASENNSIYFKIGGSTDSLDRDCSSTGPIFVNGSLITEASVIEESLKLLYFLVTVATHSPNCGESFEDLDGFDAILKVLIQYYEIDTITNYGTLILKRVYLLLGSKEGEEERMEQANWILRLIQQTGKLGLVSVMEKCLDVVSFLCRNDDSWKTCLASTGIIPILLELTRLKKFTLVRKPLLLTMCNIIVGSEKAKEFVLQSGIGFDLFFDAFLSSDGPPERLFWVLVIELAITGSFIPIYLSSSFSGRDESSFNPPQVTVYNEYGCCLEQGENGVNSVMANCSSVSSLPPQLLFDSTLSFTQPRKSSFRDPAESSCVDFSSSQQSLKKFDSGIFTTDLEGQNGSFVNGKQKSATFRIPRKKTIAEHESNVPNQGNGNKAKLSVNMSFTELPNAESGGAAFRQRRHSIGTASDSNFVPYSTLPSGPSTARGPGSYPANHFHSASSNQIYSIPANHRKKSEVESKGVKRNLTINTNGGKSSHCQTCNHSMEGSKEASNNQSPVRKGGFFPANFRSVYIRDATSGTALMHLVRLVKNVHLRDILNVLCNLCIANPRNSEVLVQCNANDYLLACLPVTFDGEIFMLISKLAELLLAHSLTERSVNDLLDLLKRSRSSLFLTYGRFSSSFEFCQHLLHIFERVTGRLSPPRRAFIHFNGTDGHFQSSISASPFVDRLFSYAKDGYTISTWFCLSELLGRETEFFSFIQSNSLLEKEHSLLELKFKALPDDTGNHTNIQNGISKCSFKNTEANNNTGGLNSASLHVRTQIPGSAPEDFFFDRWCFQVKRWYHIVFTHSKLDGMTLFVNGEKRQKSCGSFTLPFVVVNNNTSVKLRIGGGKQGNSYFYGQLGPSVMTGGVWEEPDVGRFYRCSSNQSNNTGSVTRSDKEIFSIYPIAYSSSATSNSSGSDSNSLEAQSLKTASSANTMPFFLRRSSLYSSSSSTSISSTNIGMNSTLNSSSTSVSTFSLMLSTGQSNNNSNPSSSGGAFGSLIGDCFVCTNANGFGDLPNAMDILLYLIKLAGEGGKHRSSILVEVLSIVSNVLQGNEDLRKQFFTTTNSTASSGGGYSAILNLLKGEKPCRLVKECFESILSIAYLSRLYHSNQQGHCFSGNSPRSSSPSPNSNSSLLSSTDEVLVLRDVQPFRLVLDLIMVLDINDSVRLSIIRSISQQSYNVKDNLMFWKCKLGLDYFFDLVSSCSSSNSCSYLIPILDGLFPLLNQVEEMQKIFQYLSYSRRERLPSNSVSSKFSFSIEILKHLSRRLDISFSITPEDQKALEANEKGSKSSDSLNGTFKKGREWANSVISLYNLIINSNGLFFFISLLLLNDNNSNDSSSTNSKNGNNNERLYMSCLQLITRLLTINPRGMKTMLRKLYFFEALELSFANGFVNSPACNGGNESAYVVRKAFRKILLEDIAFCNLEKSNALLTLANAKVNLSTLQVVNSGGPSSCIETSPSTSPSSPSLVASGSSNNSSSYSSLLIIQSSNVPIGGGSNSAGSGYSSSTSSSSSSNVPSNVNSRWTLTRSMNGSIPNCSNSAVSSTNTGSSSTFASCKLANGKCLFFPEVVKVLLNLAANCVDEEESLCILNELFGKLLDESTDHRNDSTTGSISNSGLVLATLWEYPWIEWISVFYSDADAATVAEADEHEKKGDAKNKSDDGLPPSCKRIVVLDKFIQRMLCFDASRQTNSNLGSSVVTGSSSSALHASLSGSTSNSGSEATISSSSYIIKVKGALTDDDSLQLHLTKLLLEYYLDHPVLHESSAVSILNSISCLYHYLEDNVYPCPSLFLLFSQVINLIAYRNGPVIRNALKSSGLIDLRDNLLLYLLELDQTPPQIQHNSHHQIHGHHHHHHPRHQHHHNIYYYHFNSRELYADFLRQLYQSGGAIGDLPRFKENNNGIIRLLYIFIKYCKNSKNIHKNNSNSKSNNYGFECSDRDISVLVLKVLAKIVLLSKGAEENRKLLAKLLLSGEEPTSISSSLASSSGTGSSSLSTNASIQSFTEQFIDQLVKLGSEEEPAASVPEEPKNVSSSSVASSSTSWYSRFFSSPPAAASSSSNISSNSNASALSPTSPTSPSSSLNERIDSFIAWYLNTESSSSKSSCSPASSSTSPSNSSSTASTTESWLSRSLLSQKIELLLQSSSSTSGSSFFSKQLDKLSQKQSKRFKARRERLLKANNQLLKFLRDLSVKARHCLEKNASLHQFNLDGVRKARFERSR